MNHRIMKALIVAIFPAVMLIGAASSASAHSHTPSASIGHIHRVNTFEGFLNDNWGNGRAASPAPKVKLSAGRYFYSVPDNGGAWRTESETDLLCDSSSKVNSNCPFSGNAAWENGILSGDLMVQVHMKSSQSWCMAWEGNGIDLEKCNPLFLNQIWVVKGYFLYNVQGTNNNSNGNPWVLSNQCDGCHLFGANVGAYSNADQSWTYPA